MGASGSDLGRILSPIQWVCPWLRPSGPYVLGHFSLILLLFDFAALPNFISSSSGSHSSCRRIIARSFIEDPIGSLLEW